MTVPEHTTPVRTTAVVTIAVVAAGFALFFARDFFQPIAIAVLLAVVFRPIVRGLERLRVPTILAAATVMLAVLAGLFIIGLTLSDPVQHWFETAPRSFAAAEVKINHLRQPLQRITAVIEKATDIPTTQPTYAPASHVGSYLAAFFGTTTTVLVDAMETLLLLFLLLSTGDLFLQKLIRISPTRREKSHVRQTVADVESAVLRFLVAMASINFGEGVVVTIVMYFLGMPHPWLWGVFTFVLEFVPYLGAAVMVGLLLVTSLTTFDSVAHIVIVPLSYILISTLQSSIVSPMAYGQRLRLNPVAVLLGVLLWWFLWGVPGAFVAVPILAGAKIIADSTENLKPLGEFLGE